MITIKEVSEEDFINYKRNLKIRGFEEELLALKDFDMLPLHPVQEERLKLKAAFYYHNRQILENFLWWLDIHSIPIFQANSTECGYLFRMFIMKKRKIKRDQRLRNVLYEVVAKVEEFIKIILFKKK